MASWHDIGEAPPLAAGADLSAKQYYIVKLDSDRAYVLAAAGTDKIMGVLQNKPTSGKTCLVYNRGKVPVIAGDTIAIGDLLTSNGDGKAIATTTGDDMAFAIATQAAASGDIFEAELQPLNRY
jgi:hypothetical protein